MFDVLDTGFAITHIELVSDVQSGRSIVAFQSRASQGEGILVKQSLSPQEKILVKVCTLHAAGAASGAAGLCVHCFFFLILIFRLSY